MTRRPGPLLTALSAVVLLTAGCTGDLSGDPDGQSRTPASPDADVVASGLEAPWSVVLLGGTPLVSERDTGRILELDAEGDAREIGVVDDVTATGEAGLLGLAVGEHDEAGAALYVYSTAEDGNRIQRYDVTGEPGSLSLGEPTMLLDAIPAASYHDGGRLAFGPDGMLYATVGDAGDPDSAQDLDSLAGKILRMTPQGEVPADNPFDDSLVYSYGHRNPQGMAWSSDGTMFATEFGQDAWDELNVITAGTNYGWPEVEGAADQGEYTDPVQQWAPQDASPSGMVHRDGTLYIANLRGGLVRAVPVDEPTTSAPVVTGYGRVRDVLVGPDGRLWFVTNNTDGRGEPAPDDDRIVAVDPGRP
jgi:glucose/arabinose dehydrogenase